MAVEIFKLFGSIMVDSDKAQDSIQKTESKAEKLGKSLKTGIATAGKWGVGIAAGAGAAVAGLLQVEQSTEEYRNNMTLLNTAFESAGHSTETAQKAYTEFYKVIGDTGMATESAQLLASLAQSEEDVAKWADISAGVMGTFGEALPINSLIEACNETAKTGVVTGGLADALNWAGLSEDEFNEKLAACATEEERNSLITETLSSTYDTATEAFKKNNEQTMAARDAQAKLDETMGKLGGAVGDVKAQLSAEFLPVIADVIDAFTNFTKGVEGSDEQLQESVQAMVDKIMEKLPDFLAFGVEIITAILKGIIKNLPTLLKAVPGLIADVVKAFLDLGGELYDVGVDLIEDLWDGLIGKWEDIKNWVSEKVTWLGNKLAFWRNGKEEMSEDSGSDIDGSHAGGLSYVPYNGYIAELHKGERVLTAEQNKQYSNANYTFSINIGSIRSDDDINKIKQASIELYNSINNKNRALGVV